MGMRQPTEVLNINPATAARMILRIAPILPEMPRGHFHVASAVQFFLIDLSPKSDRSIFQSVRFLSSK